MPVIYIDVLLAVNLLVDFALLSASSSLAHIHAKPLRMLLGSAVAAATSLVIFFPSLRPLPLAMLKLCFAGIISAAAFGLKSFKSYFRNTAAFLLVTAVFGGAVYALSMLTSADIGVNNLSFYFEGAPLALVLTVTGVYLLVRLAIFIWRGRLPQAASARLEIAFGKEIIKINALADTGNTLRDSMGEHPVVLVSEECIKNALTEKQLEFANSCGLSPPEGPGTPFRLLAYTTLSGEGALVAYFADSCKVELGKNRAVIRRPLVAVTKNGGAQAIIGDEIIKICEER